MYRDIAAHNIGTITHVGLNTFVDPQSRGWQAQRVHQGRPGEAGEHRWRGAPALQAHPINVCLVRGSYADEYGNCTVHREIGPLDVTAQCQATKNSGGIVIVQVEKIVQDLEVKTDYIAYFVIQGSSSQVYSEVYAYRFSTDDVTPAYITMRAVNPEVEFTTSQDATLYYSLFASNKLPPLFGQNLAEKSSGPRVPR